MSDKCDLCGQDTQEPTHLQLYVFGSEGITVCLQCRIALTGVASSLRSRCGAAKLGAIKAAKAEGGPDDPS